MTKQDQLTPTPASDFKRDAGSLGSPTPLPSGKVASLRLMGMDTFMKAGIIPNSLLQVIQKQIEKAQKGEQVDEEAFDLKVLLDDPTKLADIFQLVDRIAVTTFMDPLVYPTEKRDEIMADETLSPKQKKEQLAALLFVDELDMDDKFFVFSVATGGTKDLERFRSGFDASVAGVLPGSDVAKPAKSTRRTTPRKS